MDCNLKKLIYWQVSEYAIRKNESLPEIERWLSINLAYEREEEDLKSEVSN